jgi:acyl-CoA reductase-like NAD-dependent aldehyde dehydrogenase
MTRDATDRPTPPRHPLWLAGRPRETGRWMPVRDAWRGDVVAEVAQAGPDELDAAIAAAARAAPAMAALTADARRDALEHCVAAFTRDRAELVDALVREAGKPVRDARGEVDRLVDTFRVAAAECLRETGEVLTLEVSARARGTRGFTRRVPVGPCGFITPFNFPLNLVAHKVAPAIAAGCPFVLKPAPRTPLGALLIARALAGAGLPEGAFSVLPMRHEDADALVTDPRLALLSFTGGAVGWDLRARAGRKRVTLELGGNASCIVDEDPGASLEHVVERLVFGAFYQSGQSCVSVQRVLVHRALHAPLREALLARVARLRHGDPAEEATDLGPLIDEAAARRLEDWIAEAVAGGARVLCGGHRDGAMLEACVLEGVPDEARLAREEAFGPVLLLEPFDDFDAALARVNASAYGLQAGVFSARVDRVMRAWDRLEVGGVIAGDVPSFRVDAMPYGGTKASGTGREGVRWAIEDMSETRLLVLRGA